MKHTFTLYTAQHNAQVFVLKDNIGQAARYFKTNYSHLIEKGSYVKCGALPETYTFKKSI